MTYDVILESQAKQLTVLYTTTSEKRAHELACEIMLRHGQASGYKVHVRTKDSADQLQVTSGGVPLRDQPHLDAVGEALTIHVPTANLKVRINDDA